MEKGTICVFVEKMAGNFYHYLSIEGEQIEIHPWGQLLNSIKDCRADTVIIDCDQDIDTGLKLLKVFKASRSDLPVIFVAETSLVVVPLIAHRLGARDFFRKPLNVFELQESIADLLKFKRASKEKRTPYVLERHLKTGVPADTISGDKPPHLLRAIRYIERNLAEQICLESIAREARLSKYYFCKDFKRYFKVSPMKFVSFMRIERAKQLLQREDLNITEVALEVGFNDQSSFERGFRKLTGLAPREYKRSILSA